MFGGIGIQEIVIVNLVIITISYLSHRSMRKRGRLPKTWLAVVLSLIPMGPPLAGLTYVTGIVYTAILYVPILLLVFYATNSQGAEAPIFFAFAIISGYLSHRKNKQAKLQEK